MSASNIKKYIKETEKLYKENRNKALKENDDFYNKQTKNTEKVYGDATFEAKKGYEDNYRENAVQKLINEREIAENMANMGLTDSGLNRTQQTAVQLSYANRKNKIDMQKQSVVDSLARELASKKAEIEDNRLASRQSINQSFDDMINDTAQKWYKQDSDAETARIKSYNSTVAKALKNNEQDEKLKYKVRTAGGSGLDESANEVYYFYDENGKKYTYPKGTNPYTGKPITGGYTADELKTFGVWNGYQPKGVKYNGQNYGKVEKYQTDKGSVQIEHQGHYKTIWQTKDGKLWVWDDEVGNYVRAYDDGKGNITYEEY